MGAGCAKQSPAPQIPESPVAAETSVDVIEAARSNLGVPYKYGGTSPETGFDCSGFVRWAYEQAGIQLPRRAKEQLVFGERVDKKNLQPGDIVVFKGTRSRSGWHSGIYTGDGMFIHSPNKGKTVTESSLDNNYFARHYAGACRIPRDSNAEELYAAFQERQRGVAAAKKAGKSGKKNQKAAVLTADATSAPLASRAAALVADAKSTAPAFMRPAKSGKKIQKSSTLVADVKTATPASKDAVPADNAKTAPPAAAQSAKPDPKAQKASTLVADSKTTPPAQPAKSGKKKRIPVKKPAAKVDDKTKSSLQSSAASPKNSKAPQPDTIASRAGADKDAARTRSGPAKDPGGPPSDSKSGSGNGKS